MARLKHPRNCPHAVLFTDKSPHASAISYYQRPSREERLAAATLANKKSSIPTSSDEEPPISAFPGVNLTPQDALDLDPKEQPQSLKSFARESHRNSVTTRRKTLYIIDSPSLAPDAACMSDWVKPQTAVGTNSELEHEKPRADDIAEYIGAFYHGLDVKVLHNQCVLTRCRLSSSKSRQADNRGNVDLVIDNGTPTRVDFRASGDGVAKGQLNLSHMLDGLLANVPKDAFAVILLTHFDLYEDEEDDFCAGRAFGGSRICIVSTFRYNPVLDEHNKVDHAHSWPASHCQAYVNGLWEKDEPELKGRHKEFDPTVMIRCNNTSDTPLAAAVTTSRGILVPKTPADWNGLWLTRVCRTAAHELGHCVGMGHCVYYACMMQSTANIADDVRQPPYLCPVCEAKVAYTIRGEAVKSSRNVEMRRKLETQWVVEAHRRMRDYCEERSHIGMLKAYGAWLTARLTQIESQREKDDVEVIVIDSD